MFFIVNVFTTTKTKEFPSFPYFTFYLNWNNIYYFIKYNKKVNFLKRMLPTKLTDRCDIEQVESEIKRINLKSKDIFEGK